MLVTQFHSSKEGNYKALNLVSPDHHIKPSDQLNEWLEQTGFITGVSQPSSDQTISLEFRLADKYVSHFIWIRGFISLGNDFKIIADHQQRTFSVKLNISNLDGFKTYLNKVFEVLQNELIFRYELRQLIKLNAKYARLKNAIINK